MDTHRSLRPWRARCHAERSAQQRDSSRTLRAISVGNGLSSLSPSSFCGFALSRRFAIERSSFASLAWSVTVSSARRAACARALPGVFWSCSSASSCLLGRWSPATWTISTTFLRPATHEVRLANAACGHLVRVKSEMCERAARLAGVFACLCARREVCEVLDRRRGGEIESRRDVTGDFGLPALSRVVRDALETALARLATRA